MAQREGGSAELVIRMSGLEHLGASLGVDILQQLAELNLGLGLEVFEHGVGNRTRKSDSGRGLLEALVTA